MKEKFVLDACAIIALLRKEDGSEEISILLQNAAHNKIELLLHKATLIEVYYDTLRASGKQSADNSLVVVEALPITLHESLDNPFIQVMGKYKVHHKISFADSFVLALAETEGATVVSSDHHEFDPIAAAGILSFRFIR